MTSSLGIPLPAVCWHTRSRKCVCVHTFLLINFSNSSWLINVFIPGYVVLGWFLSELLQTSQKSSLWQSPNISGLLFFSPSMCWQLSLHSFLRSQPKCVGAARFVMNELWSPWHSWNICTNRCCLSVFQSLSSFPHSCDFSPFTYSPVGFFTFTFKLQQSTFNLSLGNLTLTFLWKLISAAGGEQNAIHNLKFGYLKSLI